MFHKFNGMLSGFLAPNKVNGMKCYEIFWKEIAIQAHFKMQGSSSFYCITRGNRSLNSHIGFT